MSKSNICVYGLAKQFTDNVGKELAKKLDIYYANFEKIFGVGGIRTMVLINLPSFFGFVKLTNFPQPLLNFYFFRFSFLFFLQNF